MDGIAELDRSQPTPYWHRLRGRTPGQDARAGRSGAHVVTPRMAAADSKKRHLPRYCLVRLRTLGVGGWVGRSGAYNVAPGMAAA